jgi:hypothetical protein
MSTLVKVYNKSQDHVPPTDRQSSPRSDDHELSEIEMFDDNDGDNDEERHENGHDDDEDDGDQYDEDGAAGPSDDTGRDVMDFESPIDQNPRKRVAATSLYHLERLVPIPIWFRFLGSEENAQAMSISRFAMFKNPKNDRYIDILCSYNGAEYSISRLATLLAKEASTGPSSERTKIPHRLL